MSCLYYCIVFILYLSKDTVRAREPRGNPTGSVRAGSGSQGPSHCPRQEQGSWRAPGAAPAPGLGTGHLHGDGERTKPGWDRDSWVDQLGGPHGQAGQGCGDLETCHAAVSLGEGLEAPGAKMRSWAIGRVGEAPQRLGRDRQGYWSPQSFDNYCKPQ